MKEGEQNKVKVDFAKLMDYAKKLGIYHTAQKGFDESVTDHSSKIDSTLVEFAGSYPIFYEILEILSTDPLGKEKLSGIKEKFNGLRKDIEDNYQKNVLRFSNERKTLEDRLQNIVSHIANKSEDMLHLRSVFPELFEESEDQKETPKHEVSLLEKTVEKLKTAEYSTNKKLNVVKEQEGSYIKTYNKTKLILTRTEAALTAKVDIGGFNHTFKLDKLFEQAPEQAPEQAYEEKISKLKEIISVSGSRDYATAKISTLAKLGLLSLATFVTALGFYYGSKNLKHSIIQPVKKEAIVYEMPKPTPLPIPTIIGLQMQETAQDTITPAPTPVITEKQKQSQIETVPQIQIVEKQEEEKQQEAAKTRKDKTIKIQAQKGWGFSNYAAINLGFTSFEELSKMKHKEKMKLYNNLPADQRKSLEYEVDRIWKDNKNEKGFSKTNKHYIASNAGLIVTSLDEGVYNQYAFIKFDIGKLVEIAQVAEQPQKLEEKITMQEEKRSETTKKSNLVAEYKIERANKNCLGDWNKDNVELSSEELKKKYEALLDMTRKPLCAYFNIYNNTYIKMYGKTNQAMISAWNNYRLTKNIDQFRNSIKESLKSLHLSRDKSNRLRVKTPKESIDSNKVAGVYINASQVQGIMIALESDLNIYINGASNKDDNRFKDDMNSIYWIISDYKSSLKL